MSKTQEVLEDYTREAILQAMEAAKPILRQNYRREFLEELIAELKAVDKCNPETDPFYFRAGVWCDEHEDDSLARNAIDWLRSHMEPEE